MHILIKGFRSIQQLEIDFHHESITLISGPSGSGKSTLMNAVLWCLYGTIRNVRKFGSKSGICMVKLSLSTEIVITRSKSPEAFHLQLGNAKLEDKEAQEKIFELFGTQEKWMTCCYLKQGSRNLFLESSPSERLELLSHICFQNQTPEQYIEKINAKLAEIKIQFEAENQILKKDLDNYQTTLDEFKKQHQIVQVKSVILFEESKQQIQTQIKAFDQYIAELESRYQTSWKRQKEKEILGELLLEKKSQTPHYLEYQSLITHKNQIQHLIQNTKCLPDLIKIEKKLSTLSSYIKQRECILEKIKQLSEYEAFCDLEIEPFLNLEASIKDRLKQVESYQMKKQLEEQKCKLEETLLKFQSIQFLDGQILEIDLALDECRNQQSIRKEYDELKRKVEDRWEQIESRDVTDSEIQESLELQSNKDRRAKMLSEMDMDIHSSNETIEKAKSKRKFLLHIQNLFPKYKELVAKETEMERLENLIRGMGKRDDWISEKDIACKTMEYQSSLNLLTCPNCSCKLKFDNHTLVKSIMGKPNQELGKLIEESAKRVQYKKQITVLQNEFDTGMKMFEEQLISMQLSLDDFLEYPCLESSETEKLYQEISILENLPESKDFIGVSDLKDKKNKWKAAQLEKLLNDTFYESIDTYMSRKSGLMEEKAKYQVYEKELQMICNRLQSMPNFEFADLEHLMQRLEECEVQKFKITKGKELKKLKLELDEFVNLDSEICLLQKQKQEIELMNDAKENWEKILKVEEILDLEKRILDSPFENIDDIKLLIEQERREQDRRLMCLKLHNEAVNFIEKKNMFRTQREQVVLLERKLNYLSKMKMIANEVEHKRMMSTLQTIGDFANDFLVMLFDEPIKIEFDVFKTSKTQKTVKPNIVYKILYKAHEIDSIEQMSGGEADRISLAVTCALYRFSNFPFLMLDEFASALDLNNKESAISSLKTLIGEHQKSILCISHDTVEGIYDHHFKF